MLEILILCKLVYVEVDVDAVFGVGDGDANVVTQQRSEIRLEQTPYSKTRGMRLQERTN